MALDKAIEIKVLQVDGVAALSSPLDETNDELCVYLLTNMPEVREAVLQIIGGAWPAKKVIFKSGMPKIG